MAKTPLHPIGFCRGAGIPQGPRANTVIACGCCGGYHRTDFHGDCREDSERFPDVPEGTTEVFEEDDSQ